MNFYQFNMNFCGEARRFAPEAANGPESPPNLLGIAVPYGIYGLRADAGTVFVSAGVLMRRVIPDADRRLKQGHPCWQRPMNPRLRLTYCSLKLSTVDFFCLILRKACR